MSRDYCYTSWSEPKPEEGKWRYYCYGIEKCPTTNREHYQGFIIFNRTHRLVGAKKILGAGNDCHLESRRGTRQQAREYCRKEGEFREFGEFEQLTMAELFKQDIKYLKEEYPAFYCRYYKGLQLLQSKGEKWRDVSVYIIWGPTGTFKTRSCMEKDDIYKLDPPYTWWDGYMGESKILIDDYRDGAINTGPLLNICDGYRLRLEVKGSHTWANWNEVYITTNENPEEWLTAPLRRRISNIECTCDV